MNEKTEQLIRFMRLFKGSDHVRGVFYPETRTMSTEPVAPTAEDYAKHLEGSRGLGVSPICAEDRCSWAAIDLDCHDKKNPDSAWHVNLDEIDEIVKKYNLPLVPCQSRRKGAHLYLFLSKEEDPRAVQSQLSKWSQLFKNKVVIYDDKGKTGHFANVEIFPKQLKSTPENLGNWINLPYFQAATTTRYAWAEGRILTFPEFLDLAESKRYTLQEAWKRNVKETQDAPPCVAKLLSEGHKGDGRNNSLFAIGTYLRKAGVIDSLEETLLGLNSELFPCPIEPREVKTIARSVRNKSYEYRCNESPLCDICDSAVCKTKKYGVGGPTQMYPTVEFQKLKKILTDPPRWYLVVNEQEIEFNSEELLSFQHIKRGILEKLDIIPPPLKAADWDIQLGKLLKDIQEIDAPEDVGPRAMISAMLSEFCRGAERVGPEGKPVMDDPNKLLRGLQVAGKKGEDYVVYFRGADFIQFLKRRKTEELKGAALWTQLRKLGCDHTKLRIGGSVVNVWFKKLEPWTLNLEGPKIAENF